MACILSRDVPQAEALLRQHILSTQTMVTQALALMQAA
jgi:DNA-binding GntR family transcriptional regulator